MVGVCGAPARRASPGVVGVGLGRALRQLLAGESTATVDRQTDGRAGTNHNWCAGGHAPQRLKGCASGSRMRSTAHLKRKRSPEARAAVGVALRHRVQGGVPWVGGGRARARASTSSSSDSKILFGKDSIFAIQTSV